MRDMVLELVAELHKRRERGLEIYGKPVDPSSEDLLFWLQNMKEEQIDSILYGMAAMERVTEMMSRINELEEKLSVAQDRIKVLESGLRLAEVTKVTAEDELKMWKRLHNKQQQRNEKESQ